GLPGGARPLPARRRGGGAAPPVGGGVEGGWVGAVVGSDHGWPPSGRSGRRGGYGGRRGGGRWSPSTGGRGRPGHDVDWTWFQTALMASQITSASVQRASGMATEHECAISMTLVGAKAAIAITAQPNMTHLRPTSPRMPGTIGPKNISASQKKNAAHGPQDSMFTSNLLLHWGSAPAP